MPKLKVIAVYKELRDVVICEDEEGNTVIKSMYTDEGTKEERDLVEQSIMTSGFKPEHVDIIKE